jgi:serine/threonine protein kinase
LARWEPGINRLFATIRRADQQLWKIAGYAGNMLHVVAKLENRLLAGRYRLQSKLGQGAMGSVWCATDETLRIQVAIKLIDPAIADSPEALGRFQREALAAAQLRSSHIVHITDHGVDNGTPYIAMDLLEGESLGARLQRQGKLSFLETLTLLNQAERGLTFAHSKGVIHRDLKPDNLFITKEGDSEVVKVLDFGIAKHLDLLFQGGAARTRTGMLLGTPYYMSPEQARGATQIDQRTDVWAYGVIAYQCLTGKRPFDDENLAALLVTICGDTRPIPSNVAMVPLGFDAWFGKVTACDPRERFATIKQALVSLSSLNGSKLVGPSSATADPPKQRISTGTMVMAPRPNIFVTAPLVEPAAAARAPMPSTPPAFTESAATAPRAVASTPPAYAAAVPVVPMPVASAPAALAESVSAASVTAAGVTRKKVSPVAWVLVWLPGLCILGAVGFWLWPSSRDVPKDATRSAAAPTSPVLAATTGQQPSIAPPVASTNVVTPNSAASNSAAPTAATPSSTPAAAAAIDVAPLATASAAAGDQTATDVARTKNSRSNQVVVPNAPDPAHKGTARPATPARPRPRRDYGGF